MRPRGVYLNDTKWNGHAVIVAVDSRSNVIDFRPWVDGVPLELIISELAALLERVDPARPQLTLSRSDDAPSSQQPPHPLDGLLLG